MENLEFYLKPLLNYWYYSLIAGLFLLFAAKFVEKIAIAILGFLAGINMIFPVLVEKFQQFNDFISNYYQVAMIIVGIVSAAVLYAFYKSITFIFGFGIIGILGYYISDVIIKSLSISFNFDSLYINLGVGIVLGIIGGILTYKKSSEVIGVLSILIGAGTLAAVTMKFISGEKFLSTILYSSIFIVIFLTLVVIGFVINFKKEKE
ncbi:hypothetical protein SU69_04135 [Thermosipho melanesiensis]|uniref:DUF4203 domain-containing protein n=2 Tax=Thermosipho melanesiensis TaxID=46541 RepID=A6LL70_THEM4|nr:hypothetical protein [Thermosipho melanesiensis]ABR30671.1 hypothetical protein Tmel_0810 [Thermosipho melanesiensis BI429]APT73803.1 hypothetical protein BW47_04365 [Thermosipho melanesiensis]OOC35742.1 hypothetical protein SU68_04190 [Thermosipho melanesiensis]OOC39041.1 hypothetical protein SU69_04135 [Thermosipho melanesiensis]OOC39189.1 hypothetical protein SU70_04135 [Thermosipho melanesiensis]